MAGLNSFSGPISNGGYMSNEMSITSTVGNYNNVGPSTNFPPQTGLKFDPLACGFLDETNSIVNDTVYSRKLTELIRSEYVKAAGKITNGFDLLGALKQWTSLPENQTCNAVYIWLKKLNQ